MLISRSPHLQQLLIEFSTKNLELDEIFHVLQSFKYGTEKYPSDRERRGIQHVVSSENLSHTHAFVEAFKGEDGIEPACVLCRISASMIKVGVLYVS